MTRLAAVQVLYQMALTQRAVRQIMSEHKGEVQAVLEESPESGQDVLALIDQGLFGAIVSGVERDAQALDEMISGAAASKVSAERFEPLLRAILRAGLFELQSGSGESPGAIINDYVDIAHSFFGAKEPGLVNAILDKVAKALRQS